MIPREEFSYFWEQRGEFFVLRCAKDGVITEVDTFGTIEEVIIAYQRLSIEAGHIVSKLSIAELVELCHRHPAERS